MKKSTNRSVFRKINQILFLSLSISLGLSSCGLLDEIISPTTPGVNPTSKPGSNSSSGDSDLPQAQIQKQSDESGSEDESDDSRLVSATYLVTQAPIEANGDGVLITLPLTVEHLPKDISPVQFQPERFDDETQSWLSVGEFPQYDASTRSLKFVDSFDTNDFKTQQSKPARLYRVRIYLFSNMRTVQREGSQFRIHYYPTFLANKHKVVSDANWGKPGLSEAAEIPDFVEDLDAALNAAYTKMLALEHYKGQLFNALEVQDVHIIKTGHNAGASSLGGPMSISNSVITNLEDLKLTAAHELTHVFQGQYYGGYGLWSAYQNASFIEATANYFAARVTEASDATRARFYSDHASEYLSVPLNRNNDNSMYAAGHFLDWLSANARYGPSLVGEVLRTSSGNDWNALSKTIRSVHPKESLSFAYAEYMKQILTRPEDTGKLHLKLTNNLAAATQNLMKPDNALGNTRSYFSLSKTLPPFSSTLAWAFFKNTDDALLVIDARKSKGEQLESLTYTQESEKNADYLKWQPLEQNSKQVPGGFATVPHVGAKLDHSLFNQLLINSSANDSAQISIDYYLLHPPKISDSDAKSVTWKLDSLGDIPREKIKAFNIYYKDTARQWQLYTKVPIGLGQGVQRFLFDEPVQGFTNPPEYLITVVDHLNNEWPPRDKDLAKITLSVDSSKPSDTAYLNFGERVYLNAELEGLQDQRVKWEVRLPDPRTCNPAYTYCDGPRGSLSINGLSAIYTAPGEFSYNTVHVSSVSRPEVFAQIELATTGGFCLAAGTEVTLADGTRQSIESLKRGAHIRGWSEGTGVVDAVIEGVLTHRQPSRLYRLQAADGDEIRVTGNHPVYTLEAGWIAVDKLIPGMTLHQLDRVSHTFGDNKVIGIIREESDTEVVYNLKTSVGNYFANDLLVHNKCLAPDSPIETPDGPRAVQDLKPGDQVWTLSQGHKVLTQVTKVYSKQTVLASLPAKVIAAGLLVTHNHRLLYQGQWQRAGQTDLPDSTIAGPVYDLATEAGTYLAGGVLMGLAPETESQDAPARPLTKLAL